MRFGGAVILFAAEAKREKPYDSKKGIAINALELRRKARRVFMGSLSLKGFGLDEGVNESGNRVVVFCGVFGHCGGQIVIGNPVRSAQRISNQMLSKTSSKFRAVSCNCVAKFKVVSETLTTRKRSRRINRECVYDGLGLLLSVRFLVGYGNFTTISWSRHNPAAVKFSSPYPIGSILR